MEEYKNGNGNMFSMTYPALPTMRVIRQVCVCACVPINVELETTLRPSYRLSPNPDQSKSPSTGSLPRLTGR